MRELFRVLSRVAVVVGFCVGAATGPAPALAQDGGQIILTVDAPAAGAEVMDGRRVNIGGWAVAPGAAISSVEVFLGGPGGQPLGSAELGISRRDVASALGHPEWSSSGYNLDWVPRNLPAGPLTLTVVARSTTGQTATESVPIASCGCGLRGSFTNPIVTSLGTLGWELDTGGPGVFIVRPDLEPIRGD